MAAVPISPRSLYNVSQFAHEIWQSCRTAKHPFDTIGREVSAMRTAVELVALELEDPALPVNQLDEDAETRMHYAQLAIHVGNCQQALQAAHDCLRRHEKMAAWQQLRWGWSSKEDVDGLIADLVSFATQLDSFVGALNVRAVGNMLGRIGRIEQLLDQTERDELAAVETIMADLANTGMPSQNVERFRVAVTGYAQEACKVFTVSQNSGKKTKVEHSQERKLSEAALTATRPRFLERAERSNSSDTVTSAADTLLERSRSANPSGELNSSSHNSSNLLPLLECWLIQIRTGNSTALARQKSDKEPQLRGQFQLHSMARQFRAWQASSKRVTDEYNLIGWVADDRQQAEPDPATYIWRPYAFKLEHRSCPRLLLDGGVEQQAMVIVSRALTASAHQTAAVSARTAHAAEEEAKKRARADAAALKKQAKESQAARRNEDAALERTEKQERERGKRKAEMRHLQQQVAMLGLNQQPTLADKPEATAEKKRAEKRAKVEAERIRVREMDERKANLGKVKAALRRRDEGEEPYDDLR